MKRYILSPVDSAVGQIDPTSRRPLKAGDPVVVCDRGHVWLEDSWNYNGEICKICSELEASPQPLKPAQPDSPSTPPPSDKAGTQKATIPLLLGIGFVALVAICLIIAVASLANDNTVDIDPVVETVIVEVTKQSGPEIPFSTLTPVPSKNNTQSPTSRPAPTSTPRPASSDSTCPGAHFAPRLEVDGQAIVVVYQVAVRDEPGSSGNRINVFAQNRVVQVRGGPRCANNMWWWEIYSTELGFGGWVAEADHENYFLRPR